MADLYVLNSLNYNEAVKFTLTLRYFVIKGEEGEHMWTLEIGTTHTDINGDPISAIKVHNISVDDLDEIIETNLATLCAQIDWTPLVTDVDVPYISSFFPRGEEVPINSAVFITVDDRFPSAGIDLSGISVKLNNGVVDFDITSEVTVEDDTYYNQKVLKWRPSKVIYSTYDG